jgi:hypothetical protein
MPYRTIYALAIALALLASTVVTSAKDDRDEAFEEFARLLPLATASADETNAKEVRKALDDKSPWIVVAAVEAVRQAHVDRSGAGKVFLPEILALLTKDKEKLHKEEIVLVNVLECLRTLVRKDDPESMTLVKALVEWQRWSNNEVVRLRHMAERVLFELTEQDCTLKTETLTFWDWWIFSKTNNQDTEKPPEKKSKTAPIIFKEPMVGTRLVFVIDVSDSMKWEISEKDLPGLKKKVPHLPWDKMPLRPTAMDVAKAELVHSIDKLRPAPEVEDDDKPKKRDTKRNPETRHFAIVTYSDEAKWFTNGWVEANDANCNTWMTDVDKLTTESRTNIHGGLVLAFGLSEARNETPSPEVDKDCVLTGAHTIVFLTDGYATWSNDSKVQSGTDQWGRENQIGDGEYVKREKLLELAAQLNRFRKVLINTVGIGNHDKELMRLLAKQSGGSYQDWFCAIDNPK